MHAKLAKLVVVMAAGLGACTMQRGAAAAPAGTDARTAVRPGLEVLLSDSLHLVRGRRVGLVTNHTGIDSRGVHGVERLREAGVNLVALYSPEHGFRGAAAPGAAVSSALDSATGLPIYSLYGTSVRGTTPISRPRWRS